MGAIFYGGNFMVRGQFSGEQFFSGVIILGGNHPGGNYPGGIFLWGNCPRTVFDNFSESVTAYGVFYVKPLKNVCNKVQPSDVFQKAEFHFPYNDA